MSRVGFLVTWSGDAEVVPTDVGTVMSWMCIPNGSLVDGFRRDGSVGRGMARAGVASFYAFVEVSDVKTLRLLEFVEWDVKQSGLFPEPSAVLLMKQTTRISLSVKAYVGDGEVGRLREVREELCVDV